MLQLEVFFIKSLPDIYLKNSLQSFHKTLGKDFYPDIKIIKEKETRELTLNEILKNRDKNKDLMIISDDIIFLPGWSESLSNYIHLGDIIGFCMKFPQSNLIQDFGYDFIVIDEELTYRGLYKFEDLSKIKLPDYRECDFINGCCMLIKSGVLKVVNEFPLAGQNRWGELLFCKQAKTKGFKILVLGSLLEHYGIATKQKKEKNLSSISWIIERAMWQKVCRLYLHDVRASTQFRRVLMPSLEQEFRRFKKRTLIYGCGTIADFIIEKKLISNFDICSGLPEEIGKTFKNKIILNVEKINPELYGQVIITPIGYEEKILLKLKKIFNKKITIYSIKENFKNNTIQYELKKLIVHHTR